MITYLGVLITFASGVFVVFFKESFLKNEKLSFKGYLYLFLVAIGIVISLMLAYNQENTKNIIDDKLKSLEEKNSYSNENFNNLKQKNDDLKLQNDKLLTLVNKLNYTIDNLKYQLDRQDKILFKENISLGPNASWNSPLKVDRGSRIDITGINDHQLLLFYGKGPPQIINKDNRNNIVLKGDASSTYNITITNSSTFSFNGIITITHQALQ